MERPSDAFERFTVPDVVRVCLHAKYLPDEIALVLWDRLDWISRMVLICAMRPKRKMLLLQQWSQGGRFEYARPGAHGFFSAQREVPILVAHGCVWDVKDSYFVRSDYQKLLKLFAFLKKMKVDTALTSRRVDQWRERLIMEL